MKKILFSLAALIAVGLNLTVIAQGSNGNPGDGHPVICFASYDLDGPTTITKCGNCQEIPNARNYWDQGTC